MRWILIVNVKPGLQKGWATRYFVGQYDGSKFVLQDRMDKPRYLDYGADFSNLNTMFDFPLNTKYRTGMAWMGNTEYLDKVPTEEWKG